MKRSFGEGIGVADGVRRALSKLKTIRLHEKPRTICDWRIEVRDAKTGKLLKTIKKRNVVTNGALNFYAALQANPFYNTHTPEGAPCPVRDSWQLRLGQGSGTPAAGDADLFDPVAASYKSGSVSSSGPVTTYYVRYLPEEANGYTYTEAGIFEHGNAVMMNHLMLTPTLTKDATILVDFYITFTFS